MMRDLKYGTYGYTHMNLGEKKRERCGTCRYHRKDKGETEWYCNNLDSDYFTDYTDYKDCCEDYESRTR